MSLHKGMDKYTGLARLAAAPAVGAWQFNYPNLADFNFNYWQLLNNAKSTAIANAADPNFRIAIVGAGVAGLAAARELFRCGFVNIDIYEASDRIGGRTYSIPAPNNHYTTFEMGAMRMPFFWPSYSNTTSWGPGSQNCVLDYYCSRFGITTQDFPDPGSPVVASTGIYMNNGLGPDRHKPFSEPKLQIWDNTSGHTPPPAPMLPAIYTRWTHFANMVTTASAAVYGTPQWESFWHDVVSHYWAIDFHALVYMPAIQEYDPKKPGFFGGLGMVEKKEAWVFYVIGAGDGGWGAFFEISALYPIRTLLFGFGDHHQLVQGLFSGGTFRPGPFYRQPVQDNLGHTLASPNYLGLQTVAECLFYEPVVSPLQNISLYEATQSPQLPGINLYTRNPVKEIEREENGTLRITSPGIPDGKQAVIRYDAVIVTPTTWAMEMGCVFQGFDYSTLPYEVSLSMKESHWITSCKVFYPLKQRYWEVTNPNGVGFAPIPQVISTDTFLQDVYGFGVTVGSTEDPGVLLVSYTWEDDASKLEAERDDATLARKCLDELDRILMNCRNVQMKISPYVDTEHPQVIHWERQPAYHGCAKLYRERSWDLDYALLRYNQQSSQSSGLYFAGEGYSVEGGWTEPALRMALDAVINLVNNTGGQFLNGFSYSDYPQYSPWNPIQA